MKKVYRLIKNQAVLVLMAVMFSLLLDYAVDGTSAFSGDLYTLFDENWPSMSFAPLETPRTNQPFNFRNTLSYEDETISGGFKVDEILISKQIESGRKRMPLEGYNVKIDLGPSGKNTLENQMDIEIVLPIAGIAWDQAIGSRNNWNVALGMGVYCPDFHNATTGPDSSLTPSFKMSTQNTEKEHSDIIDKIVSSLPFIGVVVKYKF